GIFLLLFLAFRSLRQTVIVMSNLPLALIGGVAAVLIASGGETSVASLVGFVTLFGIATRNGIMLMTHYNHLMIEEQIPFGRDLIVRGAMERLSPILMAAFTAGLGLLPLALSAGRPGRALAQNKSLQAAREQLRQAEARLTQAGLRPNPSLDVSSSTDVVFANEGETGFALTLSQPFETGGKRTRRIRVAEAEVELAKAE